jgi:hypothetical protein
MKHKHYEMIVAKAANMDLVVLAKSICDKVTGKPVKWSELWKTNEMSWLVDDSRELFLCLPQHKEACLHWLNGGKAEENYNSEWSDIEHHEWHDQSVFNFDDGYTIRIKPKKEKRWIAYSANQKRLGCLSFDSEQEARDHYIHEVDEPQFIQIEVEV